MRHRKALVFCIMLLAPALAWKNGAAEVVHIGISTVGLYELPTEIAKRNGFYKEEGLEVRKVAVRTGLQVAALLAAELDYSTVTGTVLRAAMQGMPLKTVMGWFDRPLHLLVAKPPIKNIRELKGKRIAVSSFGSTPHVLLREALALYGMNRDRDVTVLAIGGSAERLAALVAGSVDATPLDVAYVERAEKLGLVSILYFGDILDFRLGGLATTNEKIQRDPKQILRMVRATLKGVRFMKDNKSETLPIIRDYLGISGEYLDTVYQLALRSLNTDGTVAKNSMDNEIRLAKEFLKTKEDVPDAKIADWRFIKEVLSK